MSDLPCRNPQCKSYGRPHPNCRCYANLAMGGDVAFCSKEQAHDQGCEYFAEGGKAESPDFIPDGQFVADEEKGGPDFIPDHEFKPDDSSPDFIPDHQFVSDEEKHGSPTEQIMAGAEGFAQGMLGPLATAGEMGLSAMGVPNMSREDIEAREKANPITHGAGQAVGLGTGLLTGTGEAGLALKAGSAAGKALGLGTKGAALLKTVIANNMITGLDDASKYILSQGDPMDAVGAALAHQKASTVIGLVGGGASLMAGKMAESKLAQIAAEKWGTKAQSFLEGLGIAGEFSEEEGKAAARALAKEAGLNMKYVQQGEKLHGLLMSNIPYAGYAAQEGYRREGALGALEYGLGGLASGIVAKKLGQKYLAPAITKILSSGETNGMFDALNHAADLANGSKAIDQAIDGLFKVGTVASTKLINSEMDRQKLDEKIDDGGIDQDVQDEISPHKEYRGFGEGFAKGGEVTSQMPMQEPVNGLALQYPEQNILLQAARGRVSNYLNSLKPRAHQQKLLFDDEPDTRQKRKSYNRALDIANKPLSVMEEIKHGTVEPEHLQHLNALYPEMSQLLQKRITKKLMEASMEGQKPSYRVRQGLSMFMGVPLSSEMLPQNIQAAQMSFKTQGQSQQPAAGQASQPKKNTAKLTKSDQAYLTGNQAIQKRANKI